MSELLKKIETSADYIKGKISKSPEIALILGSGLGVLAEEIEEKVIIEYKDIPGFPISTVQGHKGQLVFGKLSGKNVVAMQGRFHFYEGYKIQDVVFPVRVMKAIGVEKLIVTNAAGGVNTNFIPGDLMIINDHINFGGVNPLIGPNFDELGARFPDMSRPYNREFISIAKKVAEELEISIQEGVYSFVTGPTYETPAEVKMLRILGADATGMSTVPEVIVANHAKMRVLGISCITNMASGILDQPLTHEEVIETTEKVKSNFINLVRKIIENL